MPNKVNIAQHSSLLDAHRARQPWLHAGAAGFLVLTVTGLAATHLPRTPLLAGGALGFLACEYSAFNEPYVPPFDQVTYGLFQNTPPNILGNVSYSLWFPLCGFLKPNVQPDPLYFMEIATFIADGKIKPYFPESFCTGLQAEAQHLPISDVALRLDNHAIVFSDSAHVYLWEPNKKPVEETRRSEMIPLGEGEKLVVTDDEWTGSETPTTFAEFMDGCIDATQAFAI